MELEATVTEDGEFDAIDMAWTVDEQTYEFMLAAAQDEGHDSAAEWLAEDAVEQTGPYQEYSTAEDREVENGYVLDMRFTEIDATAMDDMEITTDEESVSLEWGEENPANDSEWDEVTYVFEMPYEITDSNAYAVDDNVATWKLHEDTPDTLFVESEAITDDGNESKETDGNESNDESDDGLPGFGPAVAIVGLLAATMLVVYNQD